MNNKVKTNNNNGFVSLFVVLLISLLFGASLAASAQKIYTLSRNLSLFYDSDAAMLDAVSCVHIARLRIFNRVLPVVGEYDTKVGTCHVDEVRSGSGRVVMLVHSDRGEVFRSFESAFDSESYELLYIKNDT